MRGVLLARVEGVPLSAEEHPHPGGEVHRGVLRRYPDVAEVPVAVPRRDVHGSAEGYGETGEVPADADALVERLQRRAGRAGALIVEHEVLMDVVADGLHPTPSRWSLPEEVPRCLRQPVGLAVPAAQQIDQGVLGEVGHGHLTRLGSVGVGTAAVIDQGIR